MNKRKLYHPLVLLLVLSLSGAVSWAQDDEFNLGDTPSKNGNGSDLNLPGEAELTPGPEPELDDGGKSAKSEPVAPAPTPPPVVPKPQPPAAPTQDIAIPETLPPQAPPAEVSPNIISGTNSDPDFKKEERFNSIYKKFNQHPTSVEQWEKVVGQRSSEAYVIQKNDTLWDLSKTLFDDPNYWPKIWSLNKESIYNPHQINPKLHLTFYPGTKSQPPTLGLTEKPVPEAPVEIAKNETEGPLAVPPLEEDSTPKPRVRVPVLKKIPRSLPEYGVVGIEKPTLTVETKLKKKPSPFVALPYYITDKELGDVGQIKETEIGSSSAFEFQYVFVEVQDPNQKVYTVVKENPSISLGLLSSASHIEVQGEIEILNKVDDSANLYRALVKKTLLRVEVGAKLIPGSLPIIDTTSAPEKSASSAVIIGGQYGKTNIYYSANSVVFLNQGSSQGYSAGDVLPVYATYKNRNEKSSATMNERKIGSVKIVKVYDSVSTAYVLNSMEDIQQGDMVGSTSKFSGEVSSAAPSPSTEESLDDELSSESLDSAPTTEQPEAAPEEELNPEDELTL